MTPIQKAFLILVICLATTGLVTWLIEHFEKKEKPDETTPDNLKPENMDDLKDGTPFNQDLSNWDTTAYELQKELGEYVEEFTDKDGEFRTRVKAGNHQIIATSEQGRVSHSQMVEMNIVTGYTLLLQYAPHLLNLKEVKKFNDKRKDNEN